VLSTSLPTSRVLSPRQLRRKSSSHSLKRAKSLKKFTVRTYLLTFSHLHICANTLRKSHIVRLEARQSRCTPRAQSQSSCGGNRDARRAQQGASGGSKGRLGRCVCALPLPCSKQRGAAMHGVYCPQTNSRVHIAGSAELARIKSTPTDTELATQIDEVESKVVPATMSPPHPSTIHVDRVYACFNRSQNSANTSSLYARARHSSLQPSSKHSTQSGRGGAPNGFGGERCFTSARISVSSTLSLSLPTRD